MLEKNRGSITDTQDPAGRVIFVETVTLAFFSFFSPVDSEDIAILCDHLVALSTVACHTDHGRLGGVQHWDRWKHVLFQVNHKNCNVLDNHTHRTHVDLQMGSK